MSNSNSVAIGASLTADVLSALSIPGGNTLQRLVDIQLQKRREAAREALIAEVKNGFHGALEFAREDVDPLIGMLMRFWRAAEEGLAKDNLHLLAQIIAGLKKHRLLEYDNFVRWASVLENLSRDQLLIIGAAYVFDKTIKEDLDSEERHFYKPFCELMETRGFKPDELDLHFAALARFGLFGAASGWGALVYDVTAWLRELGTLANLAGLGAERPEKKSKPNS